MQRLEEPSGCQMIYRGLERSDSREYQALFSAREVDTGSTGMAKNGTDGCFVKVFWGGDPLEVIVAQLLERVGETLDVPCTIVEEIETHSEGEGGREKI